MKESQSLKTMAQKLIAEDQLVPMPRFISARELAERKAREAQEKDERRRVNFAGPSQDQEMEVSGVQRSTEPTPTTSQVEPLRTSREEMTSDESQTTVPYDMIEGDDTLITDEEMLPPDEWNASYEQQAREERIHLEADMERKASLSRKRTRHHDQGDPRDGQETYKGREVHKGLPRKIDAAATLGEKSKDEMKTTVAAATLGEKSRDEPEIVVTALAPLGEKLIVREEDQSVIAATLDHSTPRRSPDSELREETPELRVEEPQGPSYERNTTGVTSPLTKTTVLKKEVLETIARIQTQMQEQPDLPLLEDDTLSFMGTGSIGAASGDILSEACSAMTETRYETHEDAQNALYNATDNLCQSITYYKD
jgi:hypothetical protein